MTSTITKIPIPNVDSEKMVPKKTTNGRKVSWRLPNGTLHSPWYRNGDLHRGLHLGEDNPALIRYQSYQDQK